MGGGNGLKRTSWTQFYPTISPPISGTLFFQTTKNYKFSPYPFLKIFKTKVLDTDQGWHKAAVTGAALSRFHLRRVGDLAT